MNLFQKIGTMLISTSKKAHLVLVEPIILDTPKDNGLSDLEKLELTEIWQDIEEDTITFKLKGVDIEFDLSDYPELIPQIYKELMIIIFE